MNEQEMRDSEVPHLKTMDGLVNYIESLLKENDDYGKAVYVMSMAAVAAFNFAASKCGATGFQASCADLDFLRRTRHLEHGFRLIDYSKFLYPQYFTDEHFPTKEKMLSDNIEHIVKAAQALLDKMENDHEVAPQVKDWWGLLVEMGERSSVMKQKGETDGPHDRIDGKDM